MSFASMYERSVDGSAVARLVPPLGTPVLRPLLLLSISISISTSIRNSKSGRGCDRAEWTGIMDSTAHGEIDMATCGSTRRSRTVKLGRD